MNKQWVVILSGILLVVVTVGATLLVLDFSDSDADYHNTSVSRRFNIFDGYSLCEAAIKKTISGQIQTVESDDRAAKYDRASNTNQMYFVATYLPETGLFGTISKIEKRLYARCDVSAETNVVETISLREAEDEIFSEIHKRPN